MRPPKPKPRHLPIPRFNPWKRHEPLSCPWDVHAAKQHNFGRFDEFIENNMGLKYTQKNAALKVSCFVVSLKSYSGSHRLFMCSGIIIHSDSTDDGFHNTVLSSTSLLRCPTCKNGIVDDLKVDVHLADGSWCEGEIEGYDLHYNVAAISFRSNVRMETAVIGNNDGSSGDPIRTPFQIVPYSETVFELSPRLDVLAIGRYYDPPYHVMAAPGTLRIKNSSLDCKELLVTDCVITKNGIGGPVISYNGCVIGMSFYESDYTPFLPIKFALKCLEYLQKNRKVPRPWLGVKLCDLYTVAFSELEILDLTFPGLIEGVSVREVESESPASHAGLCVGDVIVQVDRRTVLKTLKFNSLVLDKVKGTLEVTVKRAGCSTPLTLVLSPQKCKKKNRWPIPKEQTVVRRRLLRSSLNYYERAKRAANRTSS